MVLFRPSFGSAAIAAVTFEYSQEFGVVLTTKVAVETTQADVGDGALDVVTVPLLVDIRVLELMGMEVLEALELVDVEGDAGQIEESPATTPYGEAW